MEPIDTAGSGTFARRSFSALSLMLLLGCGAPLPENAPAGFELHPDFAMQLVASEPVLFDPVDLDFDEEGRVFVLEMPGYPFPEEEGRVVLLEDADRDGVWDRRRVWADGLGIADSAQPYRGGLLVAAPPDLLFLEDRDRDGTAEERTVLLTGFAVGNPQHNFNGLTYGLDNWVYGANGGNGGELFWPDEPEVRLALRFDDFRVDLRRRLVERTGRSSGGFEMTFDSWGRSYSTHNLHHISHLVFPGRYLERLPPAWRRSRHRISDHGDDGPARIYPIGVQETRVNHPEQSGYFSGACGITAYTGGAFGEDFADAVFVADVVLNLIHRSLVRPDGASLVASRARQGVEFLASTDRGFRPVNMTVGPDGALYLLDMHRDVIEHPEWIPDEIEAGLDLDAGKEQGRIYRITPRSGLEHREGRLDRGDVDALVEALGDRNRWWRTTAQRLLVEEGKSAAVPSLRQVALEETDPVWRLHALWTLQGLLDGGAFDESLLLAVLGDPHPRLRESALLLAEPQLADSGVLREAVLHLADDSDARVRLQVALSLSTLKRRRFDEASLAEALLDVAESAPDDEWLRLAVLAGLEGRTVEGVTRLLDRTALLSTAGGLELLRRTSRLVEAEEIDPILVLLASRDLAPVAVAAVLEGLADAVEARDVISASTIRPAGRDWLERMATDSGPHTLHAWRLQRRLGVGRPAAKRAEMLDEARSRALDPDLDSERRLQALEILSFDEPTARRPYLLRLLGTEHPEDLQQAALRQLVALEERTTTAQDLLAAWRGLGPAVRWEAGTFLLRHPEGRTPLLDALEAGSVSLGELNLDLERRRALLFADDPDVRRRAEALFSDAGVVTRSEALVAIRPALELEGDPERGGERYAELCARCHRYGGSGVAVGPDLTEIARKSPETLLHDIVDPNAAVETGFLAYNLETENGRVLSGLLRDESDDGFVLLQAGGLREEILRRDVRELWTDGLSLMPEGLEEGLDAQAMADLLAFLQQGPAL